MHPVLVLVATFLIAAPAIAREVSEPPMTPDRLVRILTAVDPDVRIAGNRAQVVVRDVPVLVIVDPQADRMRLIAPVAPADELSVSDLERVMQANFDTALDARYALANGQLWSVFIHPLSPLERDQFLSGLGQTVNLALSYGTLFSGGGLAFGNGDSGDLQRQLIEDLLKRGEAL